MLCFRFKSSFRCLRRSGILSGTRNRWFLWWRPFFQRIQVWFYCKLLILECLVRPITPQGSHTHLPLGWPRLFLLITTCWHPIFQDQVQMPPATRPDLSVDAGRAYSSFTFCTVTVVIWEYIWLSPLNVGFFSRMSSPPPTPSSGLWPELKLSKCLLFPLLFLCLFCFS